MLGSEQVGEHHGTGQVGHFFLADYPAPLAFPDYQVIWSFAFGSAHDPLLSPVLADYPLDAGETPTVVLR
jgi:hypothetical protein